MQLALVDEGRKSVILDIAGYPPGERVKNQIGAREALPKQYGDAPQYTLVVAGGDTDIKPVPAIELEARIRRAHSLIWAGGRRDPSPFPRKQPRLPGSARSRPGREAAQRTLDGEDRSAIIRGEGKGVQEDETGRS